MFSENDKFKRQRLPACRPFLTPIGAVLIYSFICIISLFFSIIFYIHKNEIFHLELDYSSICQGNKDCSVNMMIKENIKGPFYVYYQISNVYQNNYLYSSSINYDQLSGKKPDDYLKSCNPMIKSGDDFYKTVYVPCGALPISVFNDTFQFSGFSEEINEKGITNPGFKTLFKEPNPVYNMSVNRWLENSTIFNGIKDEHFLNWIQVSPFPKILKLYGYWNKNTILSKGKHAVNIQNNYNVSSFKGKKSIVIRKLAWYNGSDTFYLILFIIITVLSFVSAVIEYILYCFNLLPLYKALSSYNQQIQNCLI